LRWRKLDERFQQPQTLDRFTGGISELLAQLRNRSAIFHLGPSKRQFKRACQIEKYAKEQTQRQGQVPRATAASTSEFARVERRRDTMMFQFVAGAPCSGRADQIGNFIGRDAEQVAALPLQPVCAPAAVSIASFAARQLLDDRRRRRRNKADPDFTFY
jgi:hypothetical protein